jgi:hypothetical protein
MNELRTTGDARRLILETLAELKSGKMAATTGLAIAATMKVLNDSLQTEVNAAKLQLQARREGADFGSLSHAGTLVLDGSTVTRALTPLSALQNSVQR